MCRHINLPMVTSDSLNEASCSTDAATKPHPPPTHITFDVPTVPLHHAPPLDKLAEVQLRASASDGH